MNIAILGYGTVGGGVHALVRDGSLDIHVRRILDIRPLEGLEGLLTDNIADILGDPNIDCVVETIGGMHPALSFVTAALRSGKHVVTSNKELISHALAPLAEGAAMHNKQIRFSASVGGGIPWVDNIARQKRAETITSVDGIVNGTTNFILDAMHHGDTFEAALRDAQARGYAEADASADLDGIDVQRKCAISAAFAFDTVIEPEHVPTLGIRGIRTADVEAFARQGYTCKLLMFAARGEESITAYVEPTLVPNDTLLAHTPTNHNCISMHGENVGRLTFYGQGAGRFPTAANVVQDLLDLRAHMTFRTRLLRAMPVVNDGVAHAYYVRSTADDLLGDLKAEAFGEGTRTKPVSVTRMHALAAEMRARDAQAFIAGIQQGEIE